MTTLYRLFDRDDRLLYVGIAGNPGRRFEQHRSAKPWWGDVTSIRVEHFPTRAAAAQAELAAIRNESPQHNIQGNGRITVDRTAGIALSNVSEPRKDRLTTVADTDLDTGSLVGSYFLSDRARQWQGCVVAEIAPRTYLVELFSWLTGGSTEQRIVDLDQMDDWTFYDTSEWLRNADIARRQTYRDTATRCDR